MHQLINEQRRTTDAIFALADAIKNAPPPIVQVIAPVADKPAFEAKETVNLHFTPLPLQVSDRKTFSPKLILAIEWLLANPDDMKESTRKIGDKISISHTWAAQAKKLIESGEYREVLEHK